MSADRVPRTVQLLDFEPIADDGWRAWLDRVNSSVIVGHANKIIALGLDDDGESAVDHVSFDRVTGVCLDPALGLRVVARHEIWTLTDGVGAGRRSPTGADRWLMCRGVRFVGGVVPADPAVIDGDCWFASVALSAVCSLDDTLSARLRWVPPFISETRPETRCRLTGLGVRDGRAAVVTAASTADSPNGWEAARVDGGVVVDIDTGEVVASGLSMPHSPRWYDGAWWLVQAGTGELGYLDGARFVAVSRIDGFARGLAIDGGVAAIGGSGSRWDELVRGYPVGDRLSAAGRRPESGVFLVDLQTGQRIGAMTLDGTAREISDVVVVPGARRVELSGPTGPAAQDWTTFPDVIAPAGG